MDLSLILTVSPAIQIHVLAATLSILGAIIILLGRKGTRWHKRIGKFWVVTMAITALSSFFIQQIRLVGDFSPIHLLSVLTLYNLYLIVKYARNRQIEKHQKTVSGLIYGALGLAGAFTFIPGRLMNHMFFGGQSMAGFVAVGVFVALIWAWHRRSEKGKLGTQRSKTV